MKKAKKILALLLCAILLICATVAGTVAYLTSKQTVNNTFTVGNVQIDLNETDVDEDGNTKANAYKLIPGIAEKKDPVVTVKAGSEDCYVRVKVTVTVPAWNNENNLFVDDNGEPLDFTQWADDFDNDYFLYGVNKEYGFNLENWEVADSVIDADNKTITYYLTYKIGADNIVKVENADINLETPFDYIYPQKYLTNAQLAALAGMTINVEAHAIQAEGFVAEDDMSAADVAWAAFDDQNS